MIKFITAALLYAATGLAFSADQPATGFLIDSGGIKIQLHSGSAKSALSDSAAAASKTSATAYTIYHQDDRTVTKTVKPMLRLRKGDYDPLRTSRIESSAQADNDSTDSATKQLYIVQFITQVLTNYRADLENAGAKIIDFIPDQAYLVYADLSSIEQIKTFPYVRWTGQFNSNNKLGENLVSSSPDSANAKSTVSASAPAEKRYFVTLIANDQEFKTAFAADLAALGGTVAADDPLSAMVEVMISEVQVESLAQSNYVTFIEGWSAPETDMDIVRDTGGATTLANLAVPYTGAGVRGEVMDVNGIRSSHQDFDPNPLLHNGTTTTSNGSHGHAVYGNVFGNGSGSESATGLLPDAQQGIYQNSALGSIRASRTAELVDPNGPYRAVFQTNSTGNTRTFFYTSVSRAMDQILFDTDLVVTQSQSNAGDQDSRPQAWAKNLISVGGIRHKNTLSRSDDEWDFSGSIGPADDGRIKPDLSFYYDSIRGPDSGSNSDYRNNFGGTSSATPQTAGHVGLMMQMWADGMLNGKAPNLDGSGELDVFAARPHMATAKAIMINTANSYSFNGTNADLTRVHQGWGTPDVENLYNIAKNHNDDLPLIIDESIVLSQLDVQKFRLYVQPESTSSNQWVKVSLVWTDPPASSSASKQLVNDLTLRMTAPDGTVYRGNVGLLTGNWSTAGGNDDNLNNVENIYIQSAQAGVWEIEVEAELIAADGHTETTAIDTDFALIATCGGNQRCTGIQYPIPADRT